MAIGPKITPKPNFISYDGNRVYRYGDHELQPVVTHKTFRIERVEAKYSGELACLLATEGLAVIDTTGRHIGTAISWRSLVKFMQECGA